jgi:hypothetical protein
VRTIFNRQRGVESVHIFTIEALTPLPITAPIVFSGHIPYRDSKLTRILQPSLGGNARTAIICNVTPASGHIEETNSTLKFASRAKAVKNKPEMNEARLIFTLHVDHARFSETVFDWSGQHITDCQ